MKIKIYNMRYDNAKEFFLGDDRCELVLEDEAFWKKKNCHVESPAELNFNILKNQTETVLFFLCCADEKPVSHFCFQVLPTRSGKFVGYIFWFYTMEAYRGKGITQYFLRDTLETIQEHFEGKIGLRTDEDNVVSRHIFEKLGFELGDTEVEVDDSVNQAPEVEYVLTKPVRCHEVENAG